MKLADWQSTFIQIEIDTKLSREQIEIKYALKAFILARCIMLAHSITHQVIELDKFVL